ncbi:WAT1-related protein [Hibiscus syriacus]|uniref:WAT1-related protein n=1 Tax=Hibiscus syriacus TaxID=106335 RepID=A0A6A2WYH2_HIBSY|nr:WAT1-related protein [Hibiscus syriacus]
MSDQLSNGPLNANFSKAKPYILMIFLQFGSAGMYIISMVTLNQGMNRYVLVVYRNAIAALVLAPFALVLERPILDQGFVYLGIKYTSASFTSAIMNAVPSVTFVIALIFRLEHVKMKEVRSIAKVIGTLVTLSGALLMTLYKGPVIELIWSRNTSHQGSGGTHESADKHRISGTLLILVGCVAWSCFYVLQSITIKKYTAEISLSSLICLAGAIQSLAIALAVEHHPSGWAMGWNSRLFAPLYSK